jgi:hypothetical protein
MTCCFSVLALSGSLVSAYVTTATLPARRQIAWLQEMTLDLQVQPVGQLSSQQLTSVHDLMYAWSHLREPPSKSRPAPTAAPRSNPALGKCEYFTSCALAVEHILKRVIDERAAGNPQAQHLLTTADYNCLLEGWARCASHPTDGIAAAERCESILQAMQQNKEISPDLSSFKAALMAWRQLASSAATAPSDTPSLQSQLQLKSHAPYRAQRLLEWMIQLVNKGENTQVMPDADCFDIVLQTWSRSGLPEAPAQTEKVLGAMERLHESTGLLSLKPRTTSFNAVLAAHARSSRPASAMRASDVLHFMEVLASEPDSTVQPDQASYSIVLHALSKCQQSEPDKVAAEVDTCLRHTEEMYKSQQSPSLQLETIMFNTAMGCWSKARRTSGAFRMARSIMDRQKNWYENHGCTRAKPDVVGYTSVIAACANEAGSHEEKQVAFSVALATYQELRHLSEDDDDAGPNHVTFATMLKACARLLPASSPLRQRWVGRVFRDAVKAGQVSDLVIARLREAATSSAKYRELLKGNSKSALPSDWTKNVDDTRIRRKPVAASQPACHAGHRRDVAVAHRKWAEV